MPPRSHTFTFQQRPRVKQRPRMSRTGNTYTPKGTLDAEKALAAAYDGPLMDGPLGLYVTFWPDMTCVRLKEWPDATRGPLRGDLDNYTKLVMDALNGVAYEDDRQIMYLGADFGQYAGLGA